MPHSSGWIGLAAHPAARDNAWKLSISQCRANLPFQPFHSKIWLSPSTHTPHTHTYAHMYTYTTYLGIHTHNSVSPLLHTTRGKSNLSTICNLSRRWPSMTTVYSLAIRSERAAKGNYPSGHWSEGRCTPVLPTAAVATAALADRLGRRPGMGDHGSRRNPERKRDQT